MDCHNFDPTQLVLLIWLGNSSTSQSHSFCALHGLCYRLDSSSIGLHLNAQKLLVHLFPNFPILFQPSLAAPTEEHDIWGMTLNYTRSTVLEPQLTSQLSNLVIFLLDMHGIFIMFLVAPKGPDHFV